MNFSGGTTGLILLLAGQILTAFVFLVGFVAITRRAVDKEIPAKLVEITTKLSEFRTEVAGSIAETRHQIDGLKDSLSRFREEYVRSSATVDAKLRYLERQPPTEERERDGR